MNITEGREILVRIDPARNWYGSLTRAAQEARRRGLGLRIVTPGGEKPRAEARGGAAKSGVDAPQGAHHAVREPGYTNQ
ncbi:hypothetical protein [Streptomyces sp. PvR034]|uniref:hypothetical protein n=1 Tax=Streptomyces sp. PvR034 TaxID=3156401 RepID=UPI00339381D5